MNQGFTLIELLVVVLIIGILSAVALPQYQTAVERSRATEALTQMSAIRNAMERYHAQRDAFPSTFTQLDVDLPQRADGSYGGKYFQLTFDNTGKIDAARDTGLYTITTQITENSSGAYSATRSCAPRSDSTEAEEYCNAITGGHNSNF